MKYLVAAICVLWMISSSEAQSYEDKRCKCICPSISSVVNSTEPSHSKRLMYIANVPPKKCNCDFVVLPKVSSVIQGYEQLFCPRCECKYENRNTTIIKVVVIIVMWVISILVIYMAFLIILDPLLNKRIKGNYQEHTNEDEEASTSGPMYHNMSVRSNVLNRVGHQQDKWKKQVKEQRRNIYDKHTMLN